MPDPSPTPEAGSAPAAPLPPPVALVPVEPPERPRPTGGFRQAVDLALDLADALAERLRKALGAPERDRA